MTTGYPAVTIIYARACFCLHGFSPISHNNCRRPPPFSVLIKFKFAEPTAQRRVRPWDEVSGITGNTTNISHSSWPWCFTSNLGHGRGVWPRTYKGQSPSGEPENQSKFALLLGFYSHPRLTGFDLFALFLEELC